MTLEDFQQEVNEGITLVDFWADWCGPCHAQAPILDTLEGVKIFKVDIEKEKDLAARFGIRSIPTLHIYKDGEWRETFVGVQTKQVLQDRINYFAKEHDAEFTEEKDVNHPTDDPIGIAEDGTE